LSGEAFSLRIGLLRAGRKENELEATFVKKCCALFLTILFALLGSAVFAAEYTFAITNDSAEDTVTQLMSLKLKELLQTKSGGKIAANVFPSGQMGKDSELTQSTQAGDIAFVLQTTAPQINFVPKVAVFDLPFIFPDSKTARTVLDGPFKTLIAKEYEKANLKLMGYGDQGFRVTTSNKPVRKLEDLKGLKIRTMENKYHVANWRIQGANPTPLPWGEVYISLQQGTIDGQREPL
jgi:TRAP-type C4-dicarboxylate transport system substrate-binding protein